MPKKEDNSEFTKASVKKKTKEILKQIAKDEGLYEYELIDDLLKEKFPKYFRQSGRITV